MHPTPGAISARVSSAPQAEAQTIASQGAAWRERVAATGLTGSEAMPFLDAGQSGATLVRPALERLRDVVAAGRVDRLSGHAPDRLARQYAQQGLLGDACRRAGVEGVCLNRALGQRPEDALRLQVQGLMAAQERAKRLERHRRGKRPAARGGVGHVRSGAPSGDRSVPTDAGGGQARDESSPDEARVVHQVCAWLGHDRLTLGEVCRRLTPAGEVTRTGKTVWERRGVGGLLQHPASPGAAAFGKTRQEPRRPRLRAQRHRPVQPRRAVSTRAVPPEDGLTSPVPALGEPEGCAVVPAQLQEHKRQARHARRGALSLRPGVRHCQHGGSAFSGKRLRPRARQGQPRAYASSRCLGPDAYRCGGARRCQQAQVRTDRVDLAVWQDVGPLLPPPERLAEAQRRRLPPETPAQRPPRATVEGQSGQRRQGVARWIDRQAAGLSDQGECEPRVTRLRQRLARWEEPRQALADAAALHGAWPLILGRLEHCAAKLPAGLAAAAWGSKRDRIRALVKRGEVARDDVHIVLRIDPSPGDGDPEKKRLQLCRGSDRAPVRGTGRRVESHAIGVQHSGLPPLPHEPQEGAVITPRCHHPYHPVMRDGLTELLDVRFHHPGVSTTLELDGPCVHRLQGSNLRAISLATAQEVLLRDGCAEAGDGQLPELIFSSGHSQGTRRAIPCGHRVSSDACGAVPLLLQALDKVVEVRVEVLLVCLGADLLPSGGGSLPDVAPALRQKVLVEHPVEVAEPVSLLTCSLLGSSLQGGWHWASDPSRSGHVSWAGSVCLSAPSPCARLSRLRVL